MIRGLLSLYSWQYPRALVYMLQNTEYQAGPYLAWFWRTTNFGKVTYRRTLEPTIAARLLLAVVRLGMLLQIIVALVLLAAWYWDDVQGAWQFGLALLISYPLVWSHIITVPLAFGRWLIVQPRQQRMIAASEVLFNDHKAIKIAIAGSYGKTSMKELLITVLSEGRVVAATPANKNVAISHAYFAQKLTGKEDIILIEYGEGAPGDVTRFAKTTHPTHAIITGIAPAHLDRYKTIERAAEDIFSVSKYVTADQVYINAESPYANAFLAEHSQAVAYSYHRVLGWTISHIAVGFEGVSFEMHKGSRKLILHSQLMGRHQIGPLALAAALADQFGLNDAQIIAGIAKTQPFEHRMQPYQLSGAWIIDDTYNGNIEGIKAGTTLLRDLPAKRKIYITPGLVDQGAASSTVHQEMGRLIAAANPEVVILMKNSATADIKKGLEAAQFDRQIIIEEDPLAFYTNLQAFVAAGDVVMMQNDWTDNYA